MKINLLGFESNLYHGYRSLEIFFSEEDLKFGNIFSDIIFRAPVDELLVNGEPVELSEKISLREAKETRREEKGVFDGGVDILIHKDADTLINTARWIKILIKEEISPGKYFYQQWANSPHGWHKAKLEKVG